MARELRLGRIGYINVLPIYHALDCSGNSNGFQVVSGTPAELNARLFAGELDVSAISSVEYGRHFRNYVLLPDLSISTEGDVGSVLFFSRLPCHRLTGKEVLLSQASATSAALLKILLYELYGARPLYRAGPVTNGLPDGCYGLLAIGDEALRLRAAGIYPYFLDLGRAWHELTGLPFVFGVWAARREVFQQRPAEVRRLHRALLKAKHQGLQALPHLCQQAQNSVNLSYVELRHYFQQLCYDLGPPQQKGLTAFFQYLHHYTTLEEMPQLEFI
ncbi:MAG: menaquinone biosynthesis protein [Deltaproteobacteria bacterium]|nr:menaquinone biosynthesis protein [Deltaproteobacteria bacterium]